MTLENWDIRLMVPAERGHRADRVRGSTKTLQVAFPAFMFACGGWLCTYPALAEQNTARAEGQHPQHSAELEPHVLLAPFHDRGLPGVGFRATFTLAHEGFIDGLNDSVGLGVGADWTRDTTWVPVVMQWNFWLSEHWSVFAEPGVALRLRDKFRDRGPDLILYGGGRLRLGQAVALTLRLGYPSVSFGVSFFL